jgi:pilus assembly protein CpaE
LLVDIGAFKLRSVTVGTLTPSSDAAATLRIQLRATGLATIAVEVTEYCRSRTDWQTRRFVEVRPDVILINAEDVPSALTSIQVLHTAIPTAWILVCTSAADTDTIFKIVRAGARELIPMPLTQDGLTQALHRHIEERDRERKNDSNANGKIYSVCSAKAGSGATTTAINIAAALSEMERARVALIDLDWPLGDAAAFLNIRPRFTVADALASAARLDSVLLESYMNKHDKLHVLAGLEDFGIVPSLDATAVSQLLEVVTQTYTHAVVDLPVCLPRDLLQITTGMSSAIVAVLTADLPSLRRTERLLRVFNGFDATDKVRLILNRVRKSDEITDSDIEKAIRQPVTWKVSNDYRSCMEAINAGKALLSTSNKYLAREFRDVARRLVGQSEEKPRGLLNLLPKTSSLA